MTDLCKAVKAHLDEIDQLVSGTDYVTHRLVQERLSDVMELLVKQEREQARLLTLEEVLEHYSLPPVFMDDLSMQEDYCMDIKPLYFDFPSSDEISFIEHWRGYYQVRQHLDEWKKSYGKQWVCWTDKPTDEQRKAVKWEGGNAD